MFETPGLYSIYIILYVHNGCGYFSSITAFLVKLTFYIEKS